MRSFAAGKRKFQRVKYNTCLFSCYRNW